MIPNFKKYKLTLTMLGPVHIGSGEKFTAQEYIIVNNGNTIFFPDMGKLYFALPEDKREGFEQHLKEPQRVHNQGGGRNDNHEVRLGEWLKSQGIAEVPESVRSNNIIDITSLNKTQTVASDRGGHNRNNRNNNRPAVQQNAQFRQATGVKCDDKTHDMFFNLVDKDKCPKCIEESGAVNHNQTQNTESAAVLETSQRNLPNISWKIAQGNRETKNFSDVQEFIRDPLTLMPYIPGSSLKGALKTILHKSGFIETERPFPSNLRIADSDLIASDNLMICSKWDEVALKGNYTELPKTVSKDRNGNLKQMNTPNPHELQSLKRVCLKPGTKMTFEITVIDNTNFAELLIKNAKMWYKKYCDEYSGKFLNTEEYTNEAILYLGGGAGFLTKTNWMIDEEDTTKRAEKVQKILDVQFGRKTAVSSRDHRNMHDTFEMCQCGKDRQYHRHQHGRLCGNGNRNNCHKQFTTSKHVNDLQDFGACPRCFKLAEVEEKFFEMGKCKIEIEEV